MRIVTALRDVTVTAGEDAEFTCELSHEDVNEGVWWLGSSPLQKNEMNQMTCRGRLHRLILTMTTPEETGCVAFVVGEERTSARLLVVPRAKGKVKMKLEFALERKLNSEVTLNVTSSVLFEEKPKDVSIMEGETATLTCTTTDVTSAVTWRKNHIPLRNSDKYELRKEEKVNLLLIYDVDPLDTGVYTCDTGDAQSSAKLIVTGLKLNYLHSQCKGSWQKPPTFNANLFNIPELPPFFQEELQSVEADEGGSATLYCELSKLGVPVQWKKDRVTIRTSRKFEVRQDGCFLQLHIKELKPEDGGSYSCQAGSAETTAAVTVKGVCVQKRIFFCHS